MLGLLVLSLAAEPAAPPLVAAPVAEAPVASPRERGRIHVLAALTSLAGVAGQDLVGGGGVHLEFGATLRDSITLALGGRLTTTFVTRTQLEVGPRIRYQLNDFFALGGGLSLFAAVTPLPGAPLGGFTTPFSLSAMLEVSGVVSFLARAPDGVARSGPVLVVAVLPGITLAQLGGAVNLPFNLVGSVSLGWSWH